MINPTGPSPLVNGTLASISSDCMMAGSVKVSVFPDPVNAMPIISRPEKLQRVSRIDPIIRGGLGGSRCGNALDLNRGWLLDPFSL